MRRQLQDNVNACRGMVTIARDSTNHSDMREHTVLEAWRRARELVIQVHYFTNRIWQPQLAHFINQLRRSSLSVQLNVAEGYALGTRKLFARHLSVAYGSAIETVDLLDLLLELSPDGKQELGALKERARRNCALVLALKHGVTRTQE